jgi:NADH-quinone oxidoreductase subunit K
MQVKSKNSMFLIQFSANLLLLIASLIGIAINRKNVLTILMCVELSLLSLILNFVIFSVYFDDVLGQIFSLLILTVAAGESAIGLAIIISYYRVRSNILVGQTAVLRG